jgi:hypothetical protein
MIMKRLLTSTMITYFSCFHSKTKNMGYKYSEVVQCSSQEPKKICGAGRRTVKEHRKLSPLKSNISKDSYAPLTVLRVAASFTSTYVLISIFSERSCIRGRNVQGWLTPSTHPFLHQHVCYLFPFLCSRKWRGAKQNKY